MVDGFEPGTATFLEFFLGTSHYGLAHTAKIKNLEHVDTKFKFFEI